MTDAKPTSSLRLETTTTDGRTVIVVDGDIDAATAPQLLAVVEALGEDVQVIELDLADLGFLDSTGIGVMAAALRRLELIDGVLELRHVPPMVVRLLAITDLQRFVTILDDLEPD